MSGQPNVVGILDFDCTAMEINELGLQPSNIIDHNNTVELSAHFQGSGIVWNWLKPPTTPGGAQWRVEYYAESMGPGPEINLGPPKLGNLTTADSYGAPETTLTVAPGTLTPGIYRLTCVVRFPTHTGLLGFFEGQMVEVY